MVEVRREGTWSYYSLTGGCPQAEPHVLEVLGRPPYGEDGSAEHELPC